MTDSYDSEIQDLVGLSYYLHKKLDKGAKHFPRIVQQDAESESDSDESSYSSSFSSKSSSSSSSSSSEDSSLNLKLKQTFPRFKLLRNKRSTEWMETVDQYKMSIKQKYVHHKDQRFLSGEEVPLAELYIEPVIINTSKTSNICVNMMFENLRASKTVIIQGSSGSGKSFIAQKIMLDWACGKHYLYFDLVFYLRCEELMCISEEMSLTELLSWSCNLTSHQILKLMDSSCNVLFVIDGFDELRLMCQDYCMSRPFKKAPPEVIVCALLRRQICPRSTLLVTTRTEFPQGKIFKRSCFINKVLGFSKKMIEEYFQKFFQDEKLFRKAHESVKANETLFTACSVPVICWIICTVIRERFNHGADVTSDLETITSIYVDFVFTVLKHHCQGLSESVPTLMRSLGQLAERGMMENQVLLDGKSVNKTLSNPADCLFLDKQETTFRFTHFSFQEFFTALYYVLLDDDESQKKVRELLHTVERGCALSCWSVTDFSNRDSEIRSAKQLQPVILFLCGLCKNESIISFFEKHNVAVSINIETQLKKWINQCSQRCSQRYQQENMLFILHCLYELHDKSFTGKVLEGLNLIDLSNISLNSTDCCVLRLCLQCCEHIRNLRLNVTSDHLKILQSALCTCEELWLMVDNISDVVWDFISAFGEGKILNHLIVKMNKKWSKNYSEIIASAKDGDVTLTVDCFKSQRKSPKLISELTFTCSRSDISEIIWKGILQKLKILVKNASIDILMAVLKSMSGLKKVHMQVNSWTDNWESTIFSLTQNCPCLNELRINATRSFIPLSVTQSLKKSLGQKGWTLTVRRRSVLIERDWTSLTEEEQKTEERATVNKEQSLESVPCASLEAESSSTSQSTSVGTEIFTPEYINKDSIGESKKGANTHRFVSPHAGQFQCSWTDLVFVMEGNGEMLYKIMSWDPRLLDGLGQMYPAGPLYSIDCFEGSISQLHLPHCEILSEENKDSLAVAHFTDGNVEILPPLKMTETHVMINITELSLFGLIKKMIFPDSPVCTQVLLFLRPITVAQKQKILNVHLLPGNVPLSEIQSQHQEKTYIETSSICHLIPGREYSLCCQPEECEVQPADELFECDFGPNFHPTFEVFLDVSIEEVKLGLLDASEKGKEVWKQRRVPLSARSQPAEPSADIRCTAESQSVDKHRDDLIQRVTSGMEISDCLKSKDMITSEMYNKVHTANPRQEKMRILFDVLDSGGTNVKAEFYRLLKEKEPHLVDQLESGPSNT